MITYISFLFSVVLASGPGKDLEKVSLRIDS